MTSSENFNWHQFDTPEQLSDKVYQQIEILSSQAIARNDCFKIVLAGGTTPGNIYKKLLLLNTDWSKWHVFFGDERCLEANDSERNSKMAYDNWLSHIAIEEKNIHVIDAQLGAEQGAQKYQNLLQLQLPFDLVVSGMGEDGHTASLFPEQINSLDKQRLTHAITDSPKPPSDRVSLSVKALSSTHHSFIIITGKSKYLAVKLWKEGVQLPINQLHRLDTKQAVDVFIDNSAITG